MGWTRKQVKSYPFKQNCAESLYKIHSILAAFRRLNSCKGTKLSKLVSFYATHENHINCMRVSASYLSLVCAKNNLVSKNIIKLTWFSFFRYSHKTLKIFKIVFTKYVERLRASLDILPHLFLHSSH